MSIGMRELRADLATHVRRAGAGESIVVQVNGAPTAMLGPLGTSSPVAGLDILLASGLVVAPRRTDRRVAEGRVTVWGSVRLDRLLGEIRG